MPIFWRDGLPPGWRNNGACLIEEVDSVIYIPDGAVEIDDYGSIRLAWGARMNSDTRDIEPSDSR